MTENRIPVSLVGLGSMGAALAKAFVAAGHPTTVWNRTPEKADPLVAQGAVRAESIAAAVAASPLTVACLTTYDATLEAFGPAAGEVAGRTLITLNSGSPAGARRVAAWAAEHGARYLDGSIKDTPWAVGGADTLIYYGGDKAVFDEYEQVLGVLGGDTVHLGPEPDLAALYETAVGVTLTTTMVGFAYGASLVGSRGLPATSMVRYSVKWLQLIERILPLMAEQIDSGDYRQESGPLRLFLDIMPDDLETAEEAKVDAEWLRPIHDLIRRAVAEGHGDHGSAALVELLKLP
ncbi:NAD(P)-dependent oxidoreductase [Spongiactinospora rosea]|nr:NAD(P)-binding domain-containing protein [Spongiactinospora rosea]